MSADDFMKTLRVLLHHDMEALNQCITQQLHSDVPLVETIGHHIVNSGGKRLRPLLVLLSARALGDPRAEAVTLAAVIEFLHTATLLHDDVVDASGLRRGRTTANQEWGNAPSVLVGDFLYARAFQLMVHLGNLSIMKVLSEATLTIAEGEVMQLMNIHNVALSEADYLRTIECKTACLFAASTHTAALLAKATTERQSALQCYGHHLGMAFQLTDDILDYQGDSATMGKNIGDDLAEGKPTLPLIYTLQHGTHEQKTLVREAIMSRGVQHMEAIQQAVTHCGALDYAQRLAASHAKKATDALAALESSEYQEAMQTLAQFAIERAF